MIEIPAGTRVYGMQLPIQSQSASFVAGWELECGPSELARIAKTADEYKKQLDEIDSEVERIRREMKEAGEAESARIVRDAKERRERMERDARTLVEQELKAAREALVRDTVRAAVKSAEATLVSKIGDSDRQRLGDEFLASVKASALALEAGRSVLLDREETIQKAERAGIAIVGLARI